jgi:5-(carboxyamino)imidazole ribonucleotide mutase
MEKSEKKGPRGHLTSGDRCKVHIFMGSSSDLGVAEKGISVLEEMAVPYAMTVASAHRTPDLVEGAVRSSNASVFLAFAGLSAALPGVVASHTLKPVIGVPVSGAVNMDSILSVVQMPPGVPVGAVGLDRGENAALLAVRVLALGDEGLRKELERYSARMREKVIASQREVLAG